MSKRSNQAWLDELRGERGRDKQALAYQDLANYLYVVVYNYLLKRQDDIEALAGFAPQELAALAQDFVQDTLEKLARNYHALLDQFRGSGKFTSWAAQIVRNLAGGELKIAYWQRRKSKLPRNDERNLAEWSPIFEFTVTADDLSPELSSFQRQIAEKIQACLQNLHQQERIALWSCVAEGRRATLVAESLNTTPNAVYLLVYRAKRKLRKYLEAEGIRSDILEIFE